MTRDIFSTGKIFRHGDTLRAWLDGKNPFPVTVEIDPCGACNSHCPRCVGGERRGRLPVSVAVRVMAELSSGGTRGIIFTGGGEPTLHSDLPVFLRAACQFGMDVGLITNGLFLTDELRTAIARYCTWVRVSLDAGNPIDYGLSHGGSDDEFHRVVENIELLATAPKCPTVGVGVLVEDATLASIPQTAELCRDAGADYVQFRPYYYGWYGDTSEGLDIPRYRQQYQKAKGYEQPGFRVLQSTVKFDKMEHEDLERHYLACWGQQFCGVITATGDVALCCQLRGDPKFVLGNILHDTFTNVWNGPRRWEVLASLDMDRDCPPLCRCDHINESLQDYRDKMIDLEHENFL